MIRARICLALALVLMAAAVPAAAGAAGAPAIEQAARAVPGSYIVTLHAGAGSAASVARELANRHGGTLEHVYAHALRGFALTLAPDAVLALARDPRVALVEEDPVVTASATQASPPWGLDRTDQRNLPLDSSYTYNTSGAGTTSYIIDTGIRISHQDLGGRASHGYDFVDRDANASDCNGHGTHVAGTVGGNSFGIAKATSLVAVRVLDCEGNGAGSDIIAGIDWVTAQHQPGESDVANMSLGTLVGTSSSIDAAVRNSIADGTVYAIAAGNGGVLGVAESACNTSPSRVAEAITVSATDSNDRKASFANYGTCVDLFAPGVAVKSAWYTGDSATNSISGTSMAAPHVAGVAAQYLGLNPGASPVAVADAINGNATTGKVSNPGSGSPNRLLFNAFLAGGSTDPTPTPSPTPEPSPTAEPTPTPEPTPSPTPTESPSDSDPGTPTLTNGVAHTDQNGAAGTWKYYKIFVPAGRSLKAVLSGPSCSLLSCNPDLDLYVAKGAKPTESSYACRVYTSSSSGTCTVSDAQDTLWYVGVHVYSGSATKSYSVTASY